MKLRYDLEADAMYISLSPGTPRKTRKVDDFTLLDFDSNGKLIGIEILDVSMRT